MFKTIFIVFILFITSHFTSAQSFYSGFDYNLPVLFGFTDTSVYFNDKVDSSYTSLNYFNSGKKFQQLLLVHDNLNNFLPFHFIYKRNYSAGYFRNSSFRNGQLDFKAYFNNKFISLYFKGKYFNSYRNEFGGISDDSLMLIKDYEPLQASVYLLDASNFIKSRLSEFSFIYHFNDTSLFYLGSNFNWYRNKRKYIDNNTTFYNNSYFNEFVSVDSVFQDSLQLNAFLTYKVHNVEFSLFGGKLWQSYKVDSLNLNPKSSILSSKLKLTNSHSLTLYVNSRYFVNGYYSNSLFLNGYISKAFTNKKIRLLFDYKNTMPALSYNYMISNHFIYEYNYQKFKTLLLLFNLRLNDKINFNYSTNIINKGLYYDFYSMPKQYDGSAHLNKINALYSDTLNKFNYSLDLTYNITSDRFIYPVSEIFAITKLYYNYKLFSGKMKSKVGLTVRYFTPYYAKKYMPALNIFYIQNENKIGGYPLFDFECYFTIKRFNLMLRVNNLLDRIDNNVWYILPDYPLWKRNFQIGMKWDLYN
jgi:hypothetical protein